MSEWSKRMDERLPEVLGSLANDIKKYSAPKPNNDNGFFAGLYGGGAGLVGGIADFTDAQTGYGRSLGDYMNSIAQDNARSKEYEWKDMIPFTSDYYTNPQGLRYGLGQQIGSSLPLAILGGGVGGLGAKALTSLGGGTLARTLGGSMARKTAGAGLFSAPFEAASEGGNLYRNMTTSDANGSFKSTDKQGSDAATNAFLKNLPVLAVGNTLEGALLGGAKLPFGRIGYGDGLATRMAKGGLPPALINGLQEGTTEALQEGISGNLKGDNVWDIYDSSTWDNPFSEGQKMAAAEAFLGSGIMGGAPGAYRGAKTKAQLKIGNDVEDYNGVDDDVKSAANEFGQYLYDNFKIDPTITSGKRSEENNTAINGAKNSWHLKGRAVDLDVGDITDEQASQIKQSAQNAGWGEVLYHDTGSGKHLHLADYQGSELDNTANMSDAESHMWALAERSSQKTGIPAEIIYGQWYHESGGFDSKLARENNNFAGITQVESNDSKQPDGGNFYKQFSSPEEFEEYYSRFITKFKGASEAKNAREFAQAIHDDGYFPNSVDNYVAGMEGAIGKAPKGKSVSKAKNAQLKFEDIENTDGVIDWAKDYQSTLDDVDEINWLDENIDDPAALFEKYQKQISEYYSTITPDKVKTTGDIQNSEVFKDMSDDVFLQAVTQHRKDRSLLSSLRNLPKGRVGFNDKQFDFDGNFLFADPKTKYLVKSMYKSPATGKRYDDFTPEILQQLRDTAPENNVSHEDVLARPNVDSKIIDRAIAYYSRTNNPGEKRLLEYLVNRNDTEGLRVAFPVLSNEQEKIGNFNPPKTIPIMNPEKKENIRGLTKVLNSIAVQKFDNAEVGIGNAPQKTKSKQLTDPESQQRLNALTGQVTPSIINPFNTDKTDAIKSIQDMKAQPKKNKSGVLATAEEKVMENAYHSAVNRGEYKKASEIARQMGNTKIADVLANAGGKPYKNLRGRELLNEIKNKGIKINDAITQGLKDNRPLAIKVAQKKLIESIDNSAQKTDATNYGQRLLETAKQNNILANDYLQSQLLKNVPKAIQHMEDRLVKAGVDVNQVKKRTVEGKDNKSDETLNTTAEAHDTEPTNTDDMQLAKGYKTQSGKSLGMADEREFIVKPDGSIDFGEITPEIEKATNGKVRAGKIRLQVGNNGFGLIHIKKRENDLKKIGYGSAEDYVNDIASNFNEIYPEKNANRFLLIKRDKRSAVMPVDLELTFDGEKYYAVISAIPMREKNLQKKLKEESPIYSKHLQGLASVSNDGAVSGGNNSNVGVTAPKATTAKSNNSSINYNIPQDKENMQDQAKNKHFGSKEDSVHGIEEVFGYKRKAKRKSLSADEIDPNSTFIKSADTYKAEKDAIRKALMSEMSKLSANPVFNPKVYELAFKYGMILISDGANSFTSWAKKMSDEFGDNIKPWLQSVWRGLAKYPQDQNFDERKMRACVQYVGVEYQNGNEDFNNICAAFADDFGGEALAENQKLLRAAHESVSAYFNPSDIIDIAESQKKESVSDEPNDSANSVVARDGKGNNKNQVGTDDVGRESGGRREQGIQSVEEERSGEQRDVGIHDSSTDSRRKTSDSTIRTEESTDTQRSTGDTQLSRGVVDSYEGMEIERSGTNGIVRVAENGRNDESDLVKRSDRTKNNSVKFKAGDLDSIKIDLPMLLPEQKEDVMKAEKRFFINGEQGMMFTNGTGAGKTFTGLGIAKRMLNQGRDNILIVSPQQEINTQWVKAAKEHFGIDITVLEDSLDIGKGVTITTYANFQNNEALTKREWDMIISDESHNLMSNENGDATTALKKLRALTHHTRGLYDRFRAVFNTKEISDLKKKLFNAKKGKMKDQIKTIENELNDAYFANDDQRKQMIEKWEAMSKDKKTKVVLLSATPFSYDKDIDYAEGYLFDYPKADGGSYNSGDGRERYLCDNFGYRMRYNKLTKPDSNIDNRVMEVKFHEKLKKSGALSGRKLEVDKDYDRGFLLVDGGIGKRIDDGFEILRNEKNGFKDLYDVLNKQFDNRDKNYLLESIKARESIKFIQEYLDSGKKVVIFHDRKKERQVYHPFQFDENTKFSNNDQKDNALAQYRRFKAEYPEFTNLNLSDLKSPIETLTNAFGDNILLLNGDIPKKQCSKNVRDFNSDDSGKNIILVQSDKGNAGISLHDVTGKHQRVLVNLGIPRRPTYAIQIEGRIYRTGNASNAIFRYLSTGTELEKGLFANTVAQRASTAENLALGEDARNLRDSFINAFMETLDGTWTSKLPNAKNEGVGGIEMDKAVNGAISEFDRAKTFYYSQQKKNVKTKSVEGVDYFATPEPLGLKLVEWANLSEGESVLEPSAGHGAIARFFSPNNKSVVIEPSQILSPILQMNVDGANVISSRFEDYYIGNKFDAVVMNPPFGSGGKTAIEHMKKAFGHLRDGGRIVAIIPDGSSCQKRFDKWYHGNEKGETKAERDGEKNAVLVKEILLPSVTFKNAGTQVNCKVLVIDKQETQTGREQTQTEGTLEFRDAKTIEEFFDRIENITLPERYKAADAVSKTTENEDSAAAKGEGNFEIDSYKHTKTGKMIPRAIFKEYIDDFKSVSSLAKRHGGYYSRYAKGFLFKDETSRGKFVKEANALLSNGHSFSGSAISEKSIFDSLEFPEDSELTPKEKAIQSFGEKLGTPVVFYEAEETLHGFHADGLTFINRNSEHPIQWVFWHESFHWLKNNNNGLYSDMLDYVKKHEGFSQYQIDKYRKKHDRTELTNEQAIEEMFADYMPKVARRVGFMKQLAKEDQSLAERFVAWIRGTLERFHEFLIEKIGGGLNERQKTAMLEAFSTLAGDMVDAGGRNVFEIRYGNRIFLRRNGKPLAHALQDSAVAMSSRGETISDLEKRAIELKRLGYTRGETLDILVDEYMPENFDPSISVFGYPQYEYLEDKFPVFWENINRALASGESFKTIENKLLTTYNKNKGISTESSFKDQVGALVIIKGAMWHVRENFTSQIRGRGESSDGGEGRRLLCEGVTRLLGGSDAWRREQRRQGKDSLNPSKSTGFSIDEKDISYSKGSSLIVTMTNVFANKIGLKSTPHSNVKVQTTTQKDRLGILDMWMRSPSEIAKKHPVFAPFFRAAAAAVERQEKLRNQFNQRLKNIRGYLKSEEDLKACTQILLSGDHEQKEYSLQELRQAGLKDNVIRAYFAVRGAMKDTYNLINDARQQVSNVSKRVSLSELEALKKHKLIKILSEKQTGRDEYIVTYKTPKLYKKSSTVSQQALDKIKQDENIHMLSETNVGDGLYRVIYEQQVPPLTNRNGYIPHFFHEYMILKKEGETHKTVGSGKTLADAIEIANKIATEDKEGQYIIRQKGFQYDGKEKQIAAIVGDREFAKMAKQVEEHTDMSIGEAKEYLRETAGVGLKGRHRFYGNALHRKGADGFETDLMWILNHHFNAASRYVALEENFKPKAISLFERVFGRFDNDYSGNTNAQYIKDYINDVNGNPTAIENKLNEALKNNPYFQSVLGDTFGDRPALQISSSVSGTMAKAKLGFLNASSALLNLTQFLNIVGRLDSYAYAAEGMKRAFNPTEIDKIVIEESGVLDNINIAADSGGYTQSRGRISGTRGKLNSAFSSVNSIMDQGMFFFTFVDSLMRKTAVLGAYHQALRENKYQPEAGSRISKKALQYAKKVNREANFDYGAHDAPNIIRRGSVLTQNALQFQKFPIKQLEFMWNILNSGNKKQAYKFWLPYILIAGFGQFPFADWIDDILGSISGALGHEFRFKVDGKKALMEWAGKDEEKQLIANAMMYGGLSTAKIDISARAGMGDIFGNLSMAGPAGSTVAQILRQAANGNPIEMIKAFSPGIGNMLQAMVGETRTTRHRVGSTYEGWERVLKAAGFRTLDEAISADLKTISLTEKARKQKRDSVAIDAYIDDPSTENFRRLKELKIKPERVQEERRKKKMNNTDRAIETMGKEQRKELNGLIDFTR